MPRFISWLVTGSAAAFLVVATASFSLPTIEWLTFAIATGVLVVSTATAYAYRSHLVTLAAALATAAVGGWTIVASLVFSQPTVQNLALGSALAIDALSIVGIVVHELCTERAAAQPVERSSASKLSAAA